MPDMPIDGGCRCGQVRVRVSQPPLFTAICHCTGCQRMSGSAYSTTAAVPLDGFSILEGEDRIVIGGLHGEQLHHRHCDHCKSWIYTDFEHATGFINVRATMFDDTSWFAPFVETYTSEALPWARIDVPHSYETFPPMEEYQTLLAEYAAQRISAS